MNQYNKNVLKKNFQDWAIFSIVNNTKLNDKPIIGWKIIAGKKVTAEVVFHTLRKFRDEIVIRAVGHKSKITLTNLTVGSNKLNFYLPDDLVLFQTEVKHIERNGDIRVKMPKMIAQVDRRKHLRLVADEKMTISLSFNKESQALNKGPQKFEKKCFDISAGGCSFIISKIEKTYFTVGEKIADVRLVLGGDVVSVNAKIVNILEEKPNSRNGLLYQGWKICTKNTFLHSQDKRIVDDFVFKYVDFGDVI